MGTEVALIYHDEAADSLSFNLVTPRLCKVGSAVEGGAAHAASFFERTPPITEMRILQDPVQHGTGLQKGLSKAKGFPLFDR